MGPSLCHADAPPGSPCCLLVCSGSDLRTGSYVVIQGVLLTQSECCVPWKNLCLMTEVSPLPLPLRDDWIVKSLLPASWVVQPGLIEVFVDPWSIHNGPSRTGPGQATITAPVTLHMNGVFSFDNKGDKSDFNHWMFSLTMNI